MKSTLVTPAGTITEAGTLMAAILLDRCTRMPPVGAAVLVVTVHVSEPAPVMVVFSQAKPVICVFCA